MKVIDRIISHFDRINGGRGGLSALAREMGHKNATTVHGWKARGVVPIRKIPAVIAVCATWGLELTPADFVEQHDGGTPSALASSVA